jgi:PAS domain-containing protein
MLGGDGAGILTSNGGPLLFPPPDVSYGNLRSDGSLLLMHACRDGSTRGIRVNQGQTRRGPVLLRTFPAEDAAFRRFAEGALPAAADPESMQRQLRERFPAAVVRVREALADPGFGPRVWYVYRYGSVTPGQRWWEEPGHAWAVLDDDRRFVEATHSLADIIEVPRDELLGRPLDAFANPDDVTAGDDLAALGAELMIRGHLHSTLRFRRMDGSPRELEYYITANAAGPGRHLVIVREIDLRLDG